MLRGCSVVTLGSRVIDTDVSKNVPLSYLRVESPTLALLDLRR